MQNMINEREELLHLIRHIEDPVVIRRLKIIIKDYVHKNQQNQITKQHMQEKQYL